jgi:hypothetical protein
MLTAWSGFTAVPMDNNALGADPARYRAPTASQRTLPKVIRELVDKGYLEFGVHGAEARAAEKRTQIRAADLLQFLVTEYAITFDSLARRPGAEIVLLRASRHAPDDAGKLLDYEDTELTDQYRAEVHAINAWLELADVTYTGNEPVAVRDRFLQRQFKNDFESCGRFVGGFWVNMPRKQRANIRIDGRRIVELDYSSMLPRLAYASVGVPYPAHLDPYSIKGLDRDVVKALLLRSLFTVGSPAEDALDDVNEERRKDGRPPVDLGRHTLQTAFDTVLDCHKLLAPVRGVGRGLRYFFTESEIMVDVLLELRERAVVALPIHDAVLVADRDADVAEQVMRDVFERHTGAPAVVKPK